MNEKKISPLAVLSAKLGQAVWLTRFTLGAVLTLSLAGAAGLTKLSSEISSVKTDVSWLVRMQKEGRDVGPSIGPRFESRGATFEASSTDSTSTLPEGGARSGLAGITPTEGRTLE